MRPITLWGHKTTTSLFNAEAHLYQPRTKALGFTSELEYICFKLLSIVETCNEDLSFDGRGTRSIFRVYPHLHRNVFTFLVLRGSNTQNSGSFFGSTLKFLVMPWEQVRVRAIHFARQKTENSAWIILNYQFVQRLTWNKPWTATFVLSKLSRPWIIYRSSTWIFQRLKKYKLQQNFSSDFKSAPVSTRVSSHSAGTGGKTPVSAEKLNRVLRCKVSPFSKARRMHEAAEGLLLFSPITTVQPREVDLADCLDIWKQTRTARLEETEWLGAHVHSYFIELELGWRGAKNLL